jgi:DNA-binding HxlR family transcriptional regulator
LDKQKYWWIGAHRCTPKIGSRIRNLDRQFNESFENKGSNMSEPKIANPFNAQCPSRDILEVIGGKWSLLILCRLQGGSVRSGSLTRSVAGISQKMLTQTLRELERCGVIERISYPEVPPRVEYKLTTMGQTLSKLVIELEQWVVQHFEQIVEAQTEFDERTVDKWTVSKKVSSQK